MANGDSRPEVRPNVLLIVSEDNGPELGCYGQAYVQTPTLDRLAEKGVRFENAYVPQAGCSQSRAAFMTGLFPHQNGQIGLATWKCQMYLEDTPNIIRSLKDSGYRTGLIGKLHINPKSAFPFDMHEVSSANFARNNLNSYARKAEEFFTAGEEPFFLSVNYPDAHRPWIPKIAGLPAKPLVGSDVTPLPYFGIDSPQLCDNTADHLNCMSRLDSLVADLLAALERTGKADNTLVVYFGDHGADLLRGKRTSYEGGVRIPLIAYWPQHCKPLVRKELVSTLDLFPTLLEVCGAQIVDGLPGRSLKPLFQPGEVSWREYLFTEYHLHSPHNFYPQRTVRDARYKLIQNLLPGEVNPGYAFTMNRFFPELAKTIDTAPLEVRQAYRRMEKPPEYELYDLQKDPFEFKSLVDDPSHAVELKRLQRVLQDWRERTSDPLLNAKNLAKLKSEVEASFVDGSPSKKRIESWRYPDYFLP